VSRRLPLSRWLDISQESEDPIPIPFQYEKPFSFAPDHFCETLGIAAVMSADHDNRIDGLRQPGDLTLTFFS
jgi:hypothetical protein